MQAKKAKAKVTNTSGLNLPVSAAPSLYDYSALQKDVFLGFGDKAKKAASKAGSVAQDVKSNLPSASGVADKASGLADKAGDIADKVGVRTASEPNARVKQPVVAGCFVLACWLAGRDVASR